HLPAFAERQGVPDLAAHGPEPDQEGLARLPGRRRCARRITITQRGDLEPGAMSPRRTAERQGLGQLISEQRSSVFYAGEATGPRVRQSRMYGMYSRGCVVVHG